MLGGSKKAARFSEEFSLPSRGFSWRWLLKSEDDTSSSDSLELAM